MDYLNTPRPELVAALVEIYKDQCYYCSCQFVEEADHPRSRTIDHFISVYQGRQQGWTQDQIHGLGNLRLACRKCNSQKSNRAWLDDGTLEPRGRQKNKVPKPDICDFCYAGRMLGKDQHCIKCGSGPQPSTMPKYMQRRPDECDHETTICFKCNLWLPRKDVSLV